MALVESLPIRVVRRDKRSGTTHPEAEQRGGTIIVYDKFLALDRPQRAHAMFHEVGHWFRQEHVPLKDIMGFAPGEGFYSTYAQDNSEEGFAEAFAAYFTDRAHLMQHYPREGAVIHRIVAPYDAAVRGFVADAVRGMDEGAMSEQQSLWLYFVCQFTTLRRILRDRAIAPLDRETPLTFSEKPVNAGDLRYGEVVLVFAREALSRQLEPRRDGVWAARAPMGLGVTFEAGDLVRVFVKDEKLLPGIRALYPEVQVAVLKLKGGTGGETVELVDATILTPAERNVLAALIDYQRPNDHSKGMPAQLAEDTYEGDVLDALHDKGTVEYREWGGPHYYRALPLGYAALGQALPSWAAKATFGGVVSEVVAPRWTDDQRVLMDLLAESTGGAYDTTTRIAARLGWVESRVFRVVDQLQGKELLRSGGGAPGGGWYVELREGVRDLWMKWLRFGKTPPTDENALHRRRDDIHEAAFDAYAYRNASLLDMVRLLAIAADRRPVNMGLIVRIMDRLAAAMELSTVAVLGRAQAQTFSGLLRRALANIYDVMQGAGMAEHQDRLDKLERALASLEG
jgi:hypothetical protein